MRSVLIAIGLAVLAGFVLLVLPACSLYFDYPTHGRYRPDAGAVDAAQGPDAVFLDGGCCGGGGDAATGGCDAGSSLDAGRPPGSDGGFPGSDGGFPGSDGGFPGSDGGAPGFDAGVPAVDAGFPEVDAGFPGGDAGGPVDAGFPGGDAGGPVDAVLWISPGYSMEISSAP
jgi:hypothetical protein